MERRRIVKMLRFSIIGLIVLTVLLFILSIHTLFSGLIGVVSGDSFGLELDKAGSEGAWLLRFNGNPKNTGLMGTRISITIGIFDLDGRSISANSTFVDLAPGEQKPFSLLLTISFDEVQMYNLNSTQAQVVFEMHFGIRTLGDLVGFTQILRITSGGIP